MLVQYIFAIPMDSRTMTTYTYLRCFGTDWWKIRVDERYQRRNVGDAAARLDLLVSGNPCMVHWPKSHYCRTILPFCKVVSMILVLLVVVISVCYLDCKYPLWCIFLEPELASPIHHPCMCPKASVWYLVVMVMGSYLNILGIFKLKTSDTFFCIDVKCLQKILITDHKAPGRKKL